MSRVKESGALLSLPSTIEALWQVEEYLDELADNDPEALKLLTLVQAALKELNQ